MANPVSKASASLYRAMAPEMPDIGWSGPMPKALSADAARAIHSCDDVVVLGVMLGEVRSYWASAGGVMIALFGGLAAGAAGWGAASAVLLAMGVPAGLLTIEARRRALQWQGVIEARLARVSSGQ